jgi:diaminopimelate decarboxylase
MISRIPLFPPDSEVNDKDHLVVGGCDVIDLVAEFGTPLYLFDEAGLREKCREFKHEFGSRYKDTTVVYSCKAFINTALLILINEEGIGLDVVSGGELGIARMVDFPMEKIYFAGNNKSREELRLALECGLGRLIVDNFHELKMLGELVKETGVTQDILLRLTPGVDPHTHKYITTGNIDSKFGIPLAQSEDALTEAMSMPGVNLLGLHFHIGSQITEVEPYQESIRNLLNLTAEMKQKHGFELNELDIGGGFAVQYTLDAPAPPISFYAEAIISSITTGCHEYGLELPHLVIEPGRSMVARAGITIYTAGVVKDVPNIRRYVSVDGGMADNIRPALYQARHEAVVANKMTEPETDTVTIAGRFCESGDILIWDIGMPSVVAGDIIVVAGCGAYCIPQSTNYNASFKPPVVMVKDGKVRLIRRRETLEDLTRCDIV